MGRTSQAKLMGNRKTTGDILCQPMTGFEKPRDGNRRAFMDIPDETIALPKRKQLDNRPHSKSEYWITPRENGVRRRGNI